MLCISDAPYALKLLYGGVASDMDLINRWFFDFMTFCQKNYTEAQWHNIVAKSSVGYEELLKVFSGNVKRILPIMLKNITIKRRVLMRSISKFVLVVSLSFLFSSQVMADEEITENSYFSKAGLKLLSGIANVATGWVELPKNIHLTGQKDTPASGLTIVTLGVLQGAWYTINRTGCGVLDLVTFMIPTNPLVDPIFVWNDFLRETEFKGYQMN